MFNDIQSKIDDFWKLEEKEQTDFLLKINERGKKDKAAFKKHLEEIGYETGNNLSFFFEAIWASPAGWDEFVYEQLHKLLNEAENGNPGAINKLGDIFYLTHLEGMTESFYSKNLLLLNKGLNSSHPEVKQYCMEGILDTRGANNTQLTSEEIQKFQTLLKDDDFKLRIHTYSNLKELNLIPIGFKLGKMDRIRAKLQGMGKLIN